MQGEARSDVWKVWIYAAAAVLLGSWFSPFLYNAGKALADVSSSKTTNGAFEWLADLCRETNFSGFHQASLFLAAAILFVPWMEWIHAGRGGAKTRGASPWQIRLPTGGTTISCGQPLRKNLSGLWHFCAGYLVVAGLVLPLNMMLSPAEAFSLRYPGDSLFGLSLNVLARAIAPAVLMEFVFRGVLMGIFMRAMRPTTSMAMTAVLFAMALSVIPPAGLNVTDPDAAGTGFEMLRLTLAKFADWRFVVGSFSPLLAFGFVLAYARWRTASLWLPIGLHTGWLFAKGMIASLGESSAGLAASSGMMHHGLALLAATIITGFLAHFLTANEGNETAIRS